MTENAQEAEAKPAKPANDDDDERGVQVAGCRLQVAAARESLRFASLLQLQGQPGRGKKQIGE